LICGNCGAKNIRRYLPEGFHCKNCDEGSWTEEWYEIEGKQKKCLKA